MCTVLREGKESLEKRKLYFFAPTGKKCLKTEEFMLTPLWILVADKKFANFKLSKKSVLQSGYY